MNEMSLNFTKTWEMCMHGKTTNLSPPDLPAIKRKSWLKLLGVTFQGDAFLLGHVWFLAGQMYNYDELLFYITHMAD